LEADSLIKNEFYNAAVNRLYYACYYAVIALLVNNKITAQTHQGVKQMFSLHFVLPNKIEQRFSIFYSRLFSCRITGDYDDFVKYDKEMLDSIRPNTEKFINVIETLLYNK
jgi:uncharacterized protein (UPF0332 family)